MKTTVYSIVCEDVAHSGFIREVLPLFSDNHRFEIDTPSSKRFRLSTKKEVLNGYADIANVVFRQYPVELLFVVVDYDDNPVEQFNAFHNDISEALFEGIRSKVMVVVPVRCIEHWLRYLQWRNENSASTKNVSMEEEKRPDSKLKLYGTKRPSEAKTDETIKQLVTRNNIKWLSSRSASFNHFYKKMEAFIRV